VSTVSGTKGPVVADEPKVQSKAESLKTVAGLTAVAIGAVVVGVIAVIALLKGGDQAAQIASSAGGIVATIVGAYFGVKVGTDQTKTAMDQTQKAADGLKAESAAAQVFAAHVPTEKAREVLAEAQQAAINAVN
jgi:hypothetical protein